MLRGLLTALVEVSGRRAFAVGCLGMAPDTKRERRKEPLRQMEARLRHMKEQMRRLDEQIRRLKERSSQEHK